MLIVAVLVFLFVHLLPGDPARLAAGPEADADTVELVRKDLGLDRPMPEQFVRSSNALRGFRHLAAQQAARFGRDRRALPAHAVPDDRVDGLGRDLRHGHRHLLGRVAQQWPDRLGMTLAVSGISFPAFALGMLLMEVFSVQRLAAVDRRR
jgi:glutathione transport system permease protein